MYKTLVIIFLLVAPTYITAQTYTELENTGLPQVKYSCCSLGDINADGLLDIVISGDGLATTVIYLNKGNNVFEQDTLNPNLPAFEFGKFDILDFDNDGDPDLVMDGRTNSSVYPFPNFSKNNGDGQFEMQDFMSFSYAEFTIFEPGDFDNDGDIDIFSTTAGLFENNGRNNFYKVETVVPALTNGSADWGDFDKDGDLDLLVTGDAGWPDYAFSKIYINQGNNVFVADTSSSLEKIRYGMAKWGDYDNDGFLDIFLCGSDENAVKIYRNNNLKFEELSIVSSYRLASPAIDLGDYNNDGWLDFVVTGSGTNGKVTKVYKNNAGINFTEETQENIQGVESGVIKFGDIDNDLDLDIILTGSGNYLNTGYGERITKIYLNNTSQSNTPPSPPIRLSANSDTTTAVLHWASGNDAETPANGLGYVLELKRGQDNLIVSPASYQLGRNIKDTCLLIKNLEPGYYYWKVKTIDNGFLASSYSGEHSFYIGDSIPVINHYPKPIKISRGSERFTLTVQNIGKGLLDFTKVEALNDWFSINTETEGDSLNIILQFSKNEDALRKGHIRLTDNHALNSPYIIEFTQDGKSIFMEDTSQNLVDISYSAIGVADYDNDNDMDMLTSGEDYYSLTTLYQNTPDSLREVNSDVFPQLSRGEIKWADYDNDGDMDVFISGAKAPYESDKQSKLFKNLGNGIFEEDSISNITAMFASKADFGDYNNDGFIDLIVSGSSDQGEKTSLFRNDKGKSLNQLSSFEMSGDYYANVFFVDFDLDYDMDILLEGELYENTGDDNFQPYTNGDFVKDRNCSWGDFDNDGDVDIFSGGLILLNDGNGFFTKSEAAGLPVNITYHAWADYDNDGDLDIIFKIYYKTYLFNNNGHAEFTQQEGISFADIQGTVAFIDYNADGKSDIVSTGFNRSGTAVTKLYTNKSYTSNTVADPPKTLQNSVSFDTVHLSWDKGSDDESASEGLSYNCYLYRLGSDTIFNSMSDHSTGQLRVPFRGNAQHNQGWKIRLDSAGIYRWAVQTIDQAYTGSLFSGEKEFEAVPALQFAPAMENQKCQVDKENLLKWDEAFIEYVKLEYKISGDENWNIIQDSITASEKQFTWTTPYIQPTEILIRISNARYDLSDTISLMLIPSIKITDPISGVESMPNDTLTIKWEGPYSDTFTVSFRPQNESDWTIIAENLTDESDSYKWCLPLVNPGAYWMKVYDSEINESADSILINTLPYLKIVNPQAKQEVLYKESTEIKWISAYADNVSISFKPSKRYYWQTLSYNYSAEQEAYTWAVSQYIFAGDSCQILIKDVNSNASDTSGYFYLVDSLTTGLASNISSGVDIRIYPNPVKDILNMELFATPNTEYGLIIYNSFGVKVFGDKVFGGINSFDLSRLPAGVYLVNLFDGKRTFNRKIVVQ